MMDYRIRRTIAALPPLNSARNKHWRVKQREREAFAVLVAASTVGARPDAPLQRAIVWCVRRSSARPDYDNLVESFKIVLDALVRCDVLADDTTEVVGVPSYGWQSSTGSSPGIEYEVAALAADAPRACPTCGRVTDGA